MQSAEEALRTGKVALLAVSGPNGAIVYRYDDTNPEGRTARMLADRAVQQAAGHPSRSPRTRATCLMREPGSRYIDFLIPGLLGNEPDGQRDLGHGFYSCRCAAQKTIMKRLIATPMPKQYFLLSCVLSRILMLVAEVGIVLGFGAWIFQCSRTRLVA